MPNSFYLGGGKCFYLNYLIQGIESMFVVYSVAGRCEFGNQRQNCGTLMLRRAA